MKSLSPAERVLRGLGITDPSEIDLEAIAWHLGARIKRCDLDGCEARIIGHRDCAIIRVNRSSRPVGNAIRSGTNWDTGTIIEAGR